jgi:hypothetical protein
MAPLHAALIEAALFVQLSYGRPLPPQSCPLPLPVSRQEILEAMSAHGDSSLTSTTTSTRFAAEALLALVRRREREFPDATQLLIDQPDWFAAHQETAGVPYAEMSAAARAAFEHHQHALVDYGPGVVKQVREGPVPVRAVDVTIFWPDSAGAPSQFRYKDTLSVPRIDVYNQRVIRFKLLEYPDMLVFDRIRGLSVRPLGFLSAIFAVIGKPDLEQNRIAISADQWQVMRGQVKVFPGVSKTGTAAIEPGGRGHKRIPADRADLRAIAERVKQPLRLEYGPPSCQARSIMEQHGAGGGTGCRLMMGGAGTCGDD